jgi:ATP-dependent DNA helicase RecG
MGILEQPVSCLKGVGEKRQEYLRRMGIETLKDLLYYFPREHEDRSCSYSIAQLPHGQRAGTRAVVDGSARTRRLRRGMTLTRVPIGDGTARGYAVWFNNPYTARQLRVNGEYEFFGRVDRFMGEVQIQNPQVTKAKERDGDGRGRLVPVYPKHGKLESRDFERMIARALELAAGKVDDIFPARFREQYGLEEINQCLKNIHFPLDLASYNRARYRLVFEEFFLLQLGLLMIKREVKEKREGISFKEVSEEGRFMDSLPYRLTGAQMRAWSEIKEDMEKGIVMNRLLQGDVGSGKTVVAALALLKAVANGHQGALMVPTEVLAEQHYLTLKGMLSDFDLRLELLSGSCTAGRRKEIYGRLKDGDIDIIIGTHSLIQEGLEFARLGLVITDEQHRFGVRQRAALVSKGANPDILVMTATPIPRSLALILYGDLDLSIIDEMPPGRKRVETYVIGQKKRDSAYGFVEKQLKEGRQAYVVCPLIEESELVEARSASEVYQELAGKYFRGYRLKLLHGRISSQAKEEVMRDFREGRIDLLVSTTVIEVGVDVPNANIIVVENAERFGLAQLHQLRGRVGRGESQSYCILINGSGSRASYERLKVLADSNDGFYISEMDLKLRGPGDFFGTRQHGLPELGIARLPDDMKTLKAAQSTALSLAEDPSFFNDSGWSQAKRELERFFGREGWQCSVI